MSIEVFTDSAANIPAAKIEELNIHVIACSYELDGEIVKCPTVPEEFDGHEFYDMLRAKAELRTSMTNSHDIAEAFETELSKGNDVVYISSSSAARRPALKVPLMPEEMLI